MGDIWVVILNVLYVGALIAVNWAIWFVLLPKVVRNFREQRQQSRDRKNSS